MQEYFTWLKCMAGAPANDYPQSTSDMPEKPYLEKDFGKSVHATSLSITLQELVQKITYVANVERTTGASQAQRSAPRLSQEQWEMLKRFNGKSKFKNKMTQLRHIDAPSTKGIMDLEEWTAYAHLVGATMARVLGIPFKPGTPVCANVVYSARRQDVSARGGALRGSILHYVALHSITFHCIAQHCITLRYRALCCIAWHCAEFHFVTFHCLELRYVA